MGRPSAPSSVRLARLEAAKNRLGELQRGEVLTSVPMAKFLGVSWDSLRNWANTIPGFAESGAFERGAKGAQYTFCPVRTLWFLLDHFRAKAAEESAATDRIVELAMGGTAAPEMRGMPLDEMRKFMDLTIKFQEQKERQKILIEAAIVSSAFVKCFSAMQEAGMRSAQEADPTGKWPPATRAIVEDVVRRIQLKQKLAADECLKALRQERTKTDLSMAVAAE